MNEWEVIAAAALSLSPLHLFFHIGSK